MVRSDIVRMKSFMIDGSNLSLEPYMKQVPIYIATRFLKYPSRKVVILSRGTQFVLASCHVFGGKSDNHVLVKCYDQERNNVTVEVDMVFKLCDEEAAEFGGRLKMSHGLSLSQVTFVISKRHRKMFMIHDDNISGTFMQFTENVLPADTTVEDKIRL